MAALRCSICSFNYPADLVMDTCPQCGEPVSYFENINPDPEWLDIIKQAGKEQAGMVPILQLDEPYPPWLFVSHDDLIAQGLKNLEDFDVIPLNGTFYELQAYLGESNCWWIEEIVEADERTKIKRDLEGWNGAASQTEE